MTAAAGALTAERDERKLVLPSARVRTLVDALEGRAPAHRWTGEGANTLPGAQHFITTVYMDTPTRAFYRRAASAGTDGLDTWDLKVRVREYYDLHSALAETATSSREVVRASEGVWLEVKRRQGVRTAKHRLRLLRAEVPAFLAGTLPREDAGGRAVLEALRGVDEPLAASCLVNYRRLAWQDEAEGLRITLDVSLAAFAPPPGLWAGAGQLIRSSLGPALPIEPSCLLEIKSLHGLPAWLSSALTAAGAREVAFSKFVAASQRIHGG